VCYVQYMCREEIHSVVDSSLCLLFHCAIVVRQCLTPMKHNRRIVIRGYMREFDLNFVLMDLKLLPPCNVGKLLSSSSREERNLDSDIALRFRN